MEKSLWFNMSIRSYGFILMSAHRFRTAYSPRNAASHLTFHSCSVICVSEKVHLGVAASFAASGCFVVFNRPGETRTFRPPC